MQRRDFVRSTLFGAGAACSLSLPTAFAALTPQRSHALRTSLAKLESQDAQLRWQPIERCGNDACEASRNVQVQITALAFPGHYRALSIDAMFATSGGLRPFRIAHYQPGAVSPVSKPFAFETGSATLAGFRVEHARADNGGVEVAGSALLGAGRLALAPGHYLLIANIDANPVDFGRLLVPDELAQPVQACEGRGVPFASLRFSVHAQAA